MTTNHRTLADLLEDASKRHNNASGRRLADIAQAADFDVSHATLNRIRNGTYQSVPSDGTIRAIAFLAGVSEDVAFQAAGDRQRTFEAVFSEWQHFTGLATDRAWEYARMRGIGNDEATEELREILVMLAEGVAGRPWTPPWKPLPDDFDSGDEPWKQSWWWESVPMTFERLVELFGEEVALEAMAKGENAFTVRLRTKKWNRTAIPTGAEGVAEARRAEQAKAAIKQWPPADPRELRRGPLIDGDEVDDEPLPRAAREGLGKSRGQQARDQQDSDAERGDGL